MNFIVEFYKNLDTVNLFIFWGVIIVVILLLIFAIIISNKNKKLEKIIASKGINIDDTNEPDIPVIKKDEIKFKNDHKEITSIANQQEQSDNGIKKTDEPFFITENNSTEESNYKSESETFIAEEHVIDYNNKTLINDNKRISNNEEHLVEKVYTRPKPYQRNVLKEMSLNQTSPIGIAKKDLNKSNEIINAKELYTNLNEKNDSNLGDDRLNNINNRNNNLRTENNSYKKGNYLEELSKNNSKLKEELNRTEYELKQEEDAIISYEELMKKKDSIKMIEEEEAIISINELLKKKTAEEKLYNLNNDEDNDKFIDELKSFRSDL